MYDFIDERWLSALRQQGLDSFDALWDLQAEWFEPPNQRRGGWSGVVRIELTGPDDRRCGLFLKRQENHTRRSLLHPIAGEPTFGAEMQNILHCQRAGVPVLDPVFYAQRRVHGKWRAILMSEELAGYHPLTDYMAAWRDSGWAAHRSLRQALIPELASVVARLHRARLVHNALHPKHVFVRFSDQLNPQVRLIDLEKMRQTWSSKRAMRLDLDTFNRRTREWNRGDRLRFLKAYLGTNRREGTLKTLWHRLLTSKRQFMRKHGELT